MRSKFSYLSLEFHELRRINPKAKLCFHYEVNESITMGTEDKEAFLGVYNDLINNVKNSQICRNNVVNLYLAGHIHAYSEKDKIILVADKMIDDRRDDLRGYLIRQAAIDLHTGEPNFKIERFKP